MGRPSLPLGTAGKVTRTELTPGKWRARALFRDYDGKRRQVTATGTTAAAAERALQVVIRDRSGHTEGDITGDSSLRLLAAMWLEEITTEGRVRPQTIDRYTSTVEHSILPALGDLKLREVTVSSADRFLKGYAKDRPALAQAIKQVLGQIMGMAVRHDAITHNPVRSVARLRTVRKEIRALDEDELNHVRRLVHDWRKGSDSKGRKLSGPKSSGDLSDIIDIHLATGLRINEVLALRRPDIDLAAAQPTLTVSGTLVQLKRKGIIRQPAPKTSAGYRTMLLPAFAVEVLFRRMFTGPANPHDAIFATKNGTWLSAHNVRRQWRSIRKGTGLEWVTPHSFRKTVATIIERELGSKVAAAQLGHSSEAMTEGFYIVKTHVVPDTLNALTSLAPKKKPDDVPDT